MIRRGMMVAALALALGAGSAAAQQQPAQGPPQGGPAAFAQRRMQALLNGITLTPQQQARVDSIVAAFGPRMPAMTPGQMPDSATRAQRRTLLAQQDSTIRSTLTPEQQQVWDRNVASMPQRGPGGPRP